MRKFKDWSLVVIALALIIAIFSDLNIQHPAWLTNLLFWQPAGKRDIALQLGLDLQGGIQVLLVADVPPGEEFDATSMETARRIIENRVNDMGLTEPVVQAQGERRIIVELPGVENPEQAVDTIKNIALLEFIDAGHAPLQRGTMITTTLGGPGSTSSTIETGTGVTSTAELGQPLLSGPGIYETILTGAGLKSAGVDINQSQYVIPFELNDNAAQVFAEYTTSHTGQYLCIALDKTIISCPVVKSAIPNGQGVIEGEFTYDEARQLALQLRYGALPVPMRVESFNRIGATLGAESIQKSIRAGTIGLAVVLLFMLTYYRLLGGLADAALIIYVLVNFALYKLIPITLTLPGIAGFLLSAGMAVDANILIFERMKEELRRGKNLITAIHIGFNRAWPSIRDAQLSTLIICSILFLFGSNFGASIIKGLAITLAIGTVVNVFTAVFATRVFVQQVAASAGEWLAEHKWWLGV